MSDDAQGHSSTWAAMIMFAAIGVLIAADLLMDYRGGGTWLHLTIESAVLAAALLGVAVLWLQLRRFRSDLVQASIEAERWRDEHRALLAGLARAIDDQFQRWGLTEAEAEVALLLLKGLSHKQIAAARATSERTIREQARAVYRKGDLAGRAELSAFFLEDLLLPAGQP